jgi:hypothetical protein
MSLLLRRALNKIDGTRSGSEDPLRVIVANAALSMKCVSKADTPGESDTLGPSPAVIASDVPETVSRSAAVGLSDWSFVPGRTRPISLASIAGWCTRGQGF